jgi:hypothetical protein
VLASDLVFFVNEAIIPVDALPERLTTWDGLQGDSVA